jgi:hypothetical protein
MNSKLPRIELVRSAPFFAVLLALAPLAFWPGYLSKPFETSDAYVHMHAGTATLWMLMLIVQPLTIGARRFTLHRIIGAASYVLAPLVVASMVLLAHSRNRWPDVNVNLLYLQLSLAAVFGLSYALAMLTRRRVALHARFMVCTGLTMIDPVVQRIMVFWWDSTPAWNYFWFTFGLTDLILLALIWLERRRPAGRIVFPIMLVVFVSVQAPVLFQTQTPAWKAFARWFASLPLT